MGTDRHIRWQGYALEQLTFSLNLFIGLSVGSLAFGITLIRDEAFELSGFPKRAFGIGLVALAVSTVLGCFAVASRLWDFRSTARKVRSDDEGDPEGESGLHKYRSALLGRMTWVLFSLQLVTFPVGLVGLIIGLIARYGHKLW